MTGEERDEIEKKLDAAVSDDHTFVITPYNEYGQYAQRYLEERYHIYAEALDNYKDGTGVVSYADASKKEYPPNTKVLMASKYSDIRETLRADLKKSGLGACDVIDLFLKEKIVNKETPKKKSAVLVSVGRAYGCFLLHEIVKNTDSFFVFASGGLGDTLAVASFTSHIRRNYGAKRLILVCKKGYGDIARMFDAIDGCICMERKQLALIYGCGCQYGQNYIIGYVPEGAVYHYKRRTELYLRHILQLPVDSEPDKVSRRFLIHIDDATKRKWSKAVILAPHANTFQPLPEYFWEMLAEELRKNGYAVYTNTAGEEPTVQGTERISLSLREMFTICFYCRGLISYRSGFSDIMALNKKIRHLIINPGKWEAEYNDVSAYGSERIINLLWEDAAGSILNEIRRWFPPLCSPEHKILSWMADAQSEELYSARIAFRDTYDYQFVQSYLDKYLPEYSDRKWLFLSGELKGILSGYAKVIVAGAGQRGKALAVMLGKEGYVVASMVDNGSEDFFEQAGISIKKPEDGNYEKACVIVSPSSGAASEAIQKQLVRIGVAAEDIVLLNDYVYAGESLEEKQYFDEDILHYETEEVFVDCGVYDLGTSIRFVENCRAHGVEKIAVHAFEPDPENYRGCVERKPELEDAGAAVSLYPYGVWCEDGEISFESGDGSGSKVASSGSDSIKVVTLDSVIHEKVTFIKMDIEGAELEALKGAKNLIQAYRPKLAICIYHKPEDLTEIPLYIKSLVPDYKLYVRHYSNNTGELVLYAVV